MPINGDEICFALRREGAIYWREGRANGALYERWLPGPDSNRRPTD